MASILGLSITTPSPKNTPHASNESFVFVVDDQVKAAAVGPKIGSMHAPLPPPQKP
jgi:hypothetical protein